jgi:uncharacterized membrane protein YgcG
MFLWVLIIASASTSYYFMDLGSSDYTLSNICPVIFAISIILVILKVSNSKGTSSSGGSGDGSSGGWGGGGDCGGGDGGC